MRSHTEDVGFGAIINKAAINVPVQVFVWTCVFISLGSPLSSNGRNSLISISSYCLFSHKIVKGRVASSAKEHHSCRPGSFSRVLDPSYTSQTNILGFEMQE